MDLKECCADDFIPIFQTSVITLTHYKPAAVIFLYERDNPAHYADAIRWYVLERLWFFCCCCLVWA